ncbi:hypothetical protein AB6A40_001048 [Gnathostoma spinigerum]|uniref:Uncharacterized protein n=1 Tax=Gnathostoma spinigerum TaxID=75299 RepID=A0ABD6E3A6_9BILA
MSSFSRIITPQNNVANGSVSTSQSVTKPKHWDVLITYSHSKGAESSTQKSEQSNLSLSRRVKKIYSRTRRG